MSEGCGCRPPTRSMRLLSKSCVSPHNRTVPPAMAPPVDKTSMPSDGSTHASGPRECKLKNAIVHRFVSLASTHTTHHGVPVCWSAGEWNARTWAGGGMEDSITWLFNDLGLDSKMANLKRRCLVSFPGQGTHGFWLPVWKFRLDRDASNGRLALSCATHVQHACRRLWRLRLRCPLLFLRPLSLPPDVRCDDGL